MTYLAAAGDGAALVVGILILLVVLALFAFWVWGIVDAAKVKDDAQFRAGNKVLWVLVMVFTGALGALIYVLVGRPQTPKTTMAA